MRAVWTGMSASPNTGATYYQHFCATLQYPWNQFENATNGFAGRTVILTDDIVITKVTMWVGTAPGGAASWTVRVRQNAANTVASLTISGAATTGTWSGELSLSAGDAVCLSATPASTPAGAGTCSWVVEYYTKGDYYLLLSAGDGPSSGTGTYYYQAFGGSNVGHATLATDLESVLPTTLTATKISTICDQNVAATYTYYVRNNTTATDSSFSAVVTTFTGISSVGSLSFSPGDRIVIKEVRAGSGAWGSIRCCITVVPSASGEVVQSYGSTVAPSTSATNYNQPFGVGASAWDATESNVAMRLPAATIKKFYVSLASAPGSGKSYAFTLRDNSGDTTLKTTVSDTFTTANNSSDVAVFKEGDLLALQAVPAATPTSSAVKIGYVLIVSQTSASNSQWFAGFAAGF